MQPLPSFQRFNTGLFWIGSNNLPNMVVRDGWTNGWLVVCMYYDDSLGNYWVTPAALLEDSHVTCSHVLVESPISGQIWSRMGCVRIMYNHIVHPIILVRFSPPQRLRDAKWGAWINSSCHLEGGGAGRSRVRLAMYIHTVVYSGVGVAGHAPSVFDRRFRKILGEVIPSLK